MYSEYLKNKFSKKGGDDRLLNQLISNNKDEPNFKHETYDENTQPNTYNLSQPKGI